MILNTMHAPLAQPVKILDLRPCQLTVGFRAAREKAEVLPKTGRSGDHSHHVVPVIRGPKKQLYLIDHHHLCWALLSKKHDYVRAIVALDLKELGKEAFLTFLDCHNLLHLYDHKGRRQGFEALPKTIGEMRDDPYRSLAGAVRRAGGYAKTAAPFAEFLWAEHMRREISASLIKDDFQTAIHRAYELARSDACSYLPGWCGTSK